MKNYIEKFKIENQALKNKILKTFLIQQIILWIKTFLIFNYRAYRQAGRFYFFILHSSLTLSFILFF